MESLEITYYDRLYLELNEYVEEMTLTENEINYRKEYSSILDYPNDDLDDVYYKVKNKTGIFKKLIQELYDFCTMVDFQMIAKGTPDVSDSEPLIVFKFNLDGIEAEFRFNPMIQKASLDDMYGLFTEYLPLEVGLPTFCESDLTMDDEDDDKQYSMFDFLPDIAETGYYDKKDESDDDSEDELYYKETDME